jgi:hypothetical protein
MSGRAELSACCACLTAEAYRICVSLFLSGGVTAVNSGVGVSREHGMVLRPQNIATSMLSTLTISKYSSYVFASCSLAWAAVANERGLSCIFCLTLSRYIFSISPPGTASSAPHSASACRTTITALAYFRR